MSIKYLVLNILLCFVILLIVIQNYETWNHSIELLPDTRIASKNPETKNENPPMMASTEKPMSIQSYVLISEKNVFSPERKDFPIVTVNKSNPASRPQVVLYGVTIAGDFQAASVVNPGRPLRKGERETMTLRLGENIGQYKLAKVLPDRITMEANGDSFEVLLYDSRSPKRRMEAGTEPKPATVASPQVAAVANPQPTPALNPLPVESPKPVPFQESVRTPKASVQTQGATSLPLNKYTYQLLGPSAAIGRGRIFYPPPGSSTQQSVGK
jgi:hypothetical protein